MSNRSKKQYIGRINPNRIRTRVCLFNKTVPHKNKKKDRYKKFARKKIKEEDNH